MIRWAPVSTKWKHKARSWRLSKCNWSTRSVHRLHSGHLSEFLEFCLRKELAMRLKKKSVDLRLSTDQKMISLISANLVDKVMALFLPFLFFFSIFFPVGSVTHLVSRGQSFSPKSSLWSKINEIYHSWLHNSLLVRQWSHVSAIKREPRDSLNYRENWNIAWSFVSSSQYLSHHSLCTPSCLFVIALYVQVFFFVSFNRKIFTRFDHRGMNFLFPVSIWQYL